MNTAIIFTEVMKLDSIGIYNQAVHPDEPKHFSGDEEH